MTAYTSIHRLQVASILVDFIENEALPGTGVERAAFWQGLDALVRSVREGKGAMPSRGWCPECSDADVSALITHMRKAQP